MKIITKMFIIRYHGNSDIFVYFLSIKNSRLYSATSHLQKKIKPIFNHFVERISRKYNIESFTETQFFQI